MQIHDIKTNPPQTLRVATAQLNPVIGRHQGQSCKSPRGLGTKPAATALIIVLFTELFVAGYPPEDLVLKPAFVEACEKAVAEFATINADGGPGIIIGLPLRRKTGLHNACRLSTAAKSLPSVSRSICRTTANLTKNAYFNRARCRVLSIFADAHRRPDLRRYLG